MTRVRTERFTREEETNCKRKEKLGRMEMDPTRYIRAPGIFQRLDAPSTSDAHTSRNIKIITNQSHPSFNVAILEKAYTI